jgi:hypothetical protein
MWAAPVALEYAKLRSLVQSVRIAVLAPIRVPYASNVSDMGGPIKNAGPAYINLPSGSGEIGSWMD